jgi:glutaredoxin/cytochrome c biogenesis protein CcdA
MFVLDDTEVRAAAAGGEPRPASTSSMTEPWRTRRSARSFVAVLVMALVGAATIVEPAEAAKRAPTLEVYTRSGCSHCERAKAYLQELQARRSGIEVVVHDIAADRGARDRLRALAEQHRTLLAVPAFVLGDRMTVGFDDASTTGAMLERWLDDQQGELEVVELPVFGQVRVRDLGLPVFSLVLGLVDGFNPCAMWVLVFLLSLLVNLHSRRRMAAIGGTFVAVSAIAYYLFMAAWLGMFLWVGVSRWLQAVLGLVAIAVGSLHIKDCLWPHRGPSLSIPDRAKPTIYARVRRIVYAENMAGALAAAVALAFMVNLVELLCTAGLPALFAQILSAHGLTWWEHQAYLALYVTAYMFDDAVMLGIAVITLSRRKVQERAGRALKLVSGAVMLALGVLLLLRPEWLMFH